MVRRRVELPDVARRCWPNAIELVETLTKECATLEHEAWYLGGGTALAADWKHRTSTDIDILIAQGLSISALGPEANARIDRVIERRHGQRLARFGSTACSAVCARSCGRGDLRVRIVRVGPVRVRAFFLRVRSNRANSARVGVVRPDASASRVVRIAALASSVVASMPTVRPTTSVASASRCTPTRGGSRGQSGGGCATASSGPAGPRGGRSPETCDQKLTVKYEQGGKVDIFSSGRQLPGHEEAIEVDGMPAQRLSDAQIFAGKLRRAIEGQPAARDLFDICYATKTGRRGFEQAVNALTGDEQRRIVVLWETAGGKIAGEARTNLAGIKELDRIPPEKLAKRAATALREHRYARTIIRAGRGRAVVRTRTFSGEWRDYESTTETARRDFEARGVNRYLASQNIRPDQVIDKVLKHIDNREMVEIRQIERRLSARDASGPGAPERPTPAGTGHRGGQTGPPRSTSGTRTGPGDR